MAKETKDTKAAAAAAEQEEVQDGLRNANMMTDKAVVAAMEDIEKEKDDEKKQEAKIQICIATYDNRKKVLMKRKRKAEDKLEKYGLEQTHALLERYLGVKCEIKDGELMPTKNKIDDKERLTAVEHKRELMKLNKEMREKESVIDEEYRKGVEELRNSYESKYRWYLNDW